jgi:hypothetical protein
MDIKLSNVSLPAAEAEIARAIGIAPEPPKENPIDIISALKTSCYGVAYADHSAGVPGADPYVILQIGELQIFMSSAEAFWLATELSSHALSCHIKCSLCTLRRS